MNIETRPPSEVIREAIRVLAAEMGPADTARVINYFCVGYGEYTRERRQTFAGCTMDDIVREIEKNERSDA